MSEKSGYQADTFIRIGVLGSIALIAAKIYCPCGASMNIAAITLSTIGILLFIASAVYLSLWDNSKLPDCLDNDIINGFIVSALPALCTLSIFSGAAISAAATGYDISDSHLVSICWVIMATSLLTAICSAMFGACIILNHINNQSLDAREDRSIGQILSFARLSTDQPGTGLIWDAQNGCYGYSV